MFQIRKNVFETNSSSTHSIAIPKKAEKEYPSFVRFELGEFGWEFTDDVDPADYLYTAILSRGYDERAEERLSHIKKVLDERGIKYEFEPPELEEIEWGDKKWLDYGYVDHAEELDEFFTAVFKDDESLLNFIFFGIVITGNDNVSDGSEIAFVYRDSPTYEEENFNKKTKKWEIKDLPNPYYKKEYEDYDWFHKGN